MEQRRVPRFTVLSWLVEPMTSIPIITFCTYLKPCPITVMMMATSHT